MVARPGPDPSARPTTPEAAALVRTAFEKGCRTPTSETARSHGPDLARLLGKNPELTEYTALLLSTNATAAGGHTTVHPILQRDTG